MYLNSIGPKHLKSFRKRVSIECGENETNSQCLDIVKPGLLFLGRRKCERVSIVILVKISTIPFLYRSPNKLTEAQMRESAKTVRLICQPRSKLGDGNAFLSYYIFNYDFNFNIFFSIERCN